MPTSLRRLQKLGEKPKHPHSIPCSSHSPGSTEDLSPRDQLTVRGQTQPGLEPRTKPQFSPTSMKHISIILHTQSLLVLFAGSPRRNILDSESRNTHKYFFQLIRAVLKHPLAAEFTHRACSQHRKARAQSICVTKALYRHKTLSPGCKRPGHQTFPRQLEPAGPCSPTLGNLQKWGTKHFHCQEVAKMKEQFKLTDSADILGCIYFKFLSKLHPSWGVS